MKQWGLTRPSGNKIQLKYQCCSTPKGLGNCQKKNSAWNNDGGGDNRYMDRHNAVCGTDQVMTQWQLQTANRKFRFEYECCDVNAGLDKCSQHSTPMNDDGGGKVRHLDRHNVNCPASTMMTQWRLTRPSGSQIRFDYTCCSAKGAPRLEQPITSGKTVFLRTHFGKHIDVEGEAVRARWNDQGGWQKLKIETKEGGAIKSGKTVFLTAHTGKVNASKDTALASKASISPHVTASLVTASKASEVAAKVSASKASEVAVKVTASKAAEVEVKVSASKASASHNDSASAEPTQQTWLGKLEGKLWSWFSPATVHTA